MKKHREVSSIGHDETTRRQHQVLEGTFAPRLCQLTILDRYRWNMSLLCPQHEQDKTLGRAY